MEINMPVNVIELLSNFSGAVAMGVIFYYLIGRLISIFSDVAQKFVEESDKNREFLQQQQNHFIESMSLLGKEVRAVSSKVDQLDNKVDERVDNLDHKVDALHERQLEIKHITEGMYKHNVQIVDELKKYKKKQFTIA